jgi:predicted RNase H-like nuclease (RuvC/YqgF family)
MSKIRNEFQEPPPQLDEDGNPIVVEVVSMTRTSNTHTLEDLMKKLEKLKIENKKLKAKGTKGKTYSYSSEDGDSSFEEEVSKKGRKGRNKHDKPSYNSMSFNYNSMPISTSYTSIPVGKTPRFDGSNYNQ